MRLDARVLAAAAAVPWDAAVPQASSVLAEVPRARGPSGPAAARWAASAAVAVLRPVRRRLACLVPVVAPGAAAETLGGAASAQRDVPELPAPRRLEPLARRSVPDALEVQAAVVPVVRLAVVRQPAVPAVPAAAAAAAARPA